MSNTLEYINPKIHCHQTSLSLRVPTTFYLVNFISNKSKKVKTLKYVTVTCMCEIHIPPTLCPDYDDVGKMLYHHSK